MISPIAHDTLRCATVHRCVHTRPLEPHLESTDNQSQPEVHNSSDEIVLVISLWSSGKFLATDPDVRVRFSEILERKSSGSGLEIREYSRRDPSR
jgi:hypothetical protein